MKSVEIFFFILSFEIKKKIFFFIKFWVFIDDSTCQAVINFLNKVSKKLFYFISRMQKR
jgi:hypothetical protein